MKKIYLLLMCICIGCERPMPRIHHPIKPTRPHNYDFDIHAKFVGHIVAEAMVMCPKCRMSVHFNEIYYYKGKEVMQCGWCWRLTLIQQIIEKQYNNKKYFAAYLIDNVNTKLTAKQNDLFNSKQQYDFRIKTKSYKHGKNF